MRIAIEGQRLFRKRKHGMDMVALELIRHLQEIDQENQYFIFIKPGEDRQCLKETANFFLIELDGGSYPVWEQKTLPKAVKEYKCDLLHCTSNTAPLNPGVPLVVTLHDIIYMEKNPLFAKGFTTYQRFGNAYRRLIVPRILKKACKIITVSGFEKKRIGEFFGINNDRLRAVYNGVGEHFKPISDKTELERIRMKYNLPGRFLFFIGNTDPKKNTKGVLEAFSIYKKENADDIPLIMPDYEFSALNAILKDIGDPGLINEIKLTGYIDNNELPGIYNLCTAFLYPSLRESFGIPILEAQRCGCPLITSNTSSMPEVAGDAALLVDPFHPADIALKIKMILNDEALRSKTRKEGLNNAQRFSWRKMAGEVLEIYRQIMTKK